jgi:7-carboxy-7-deazaguanine synthase
VFIRFWGCNLSCDFCDSRFSWDASLEKPKPFSLDDVVKKIKSFSVKNLIFTGGEPMLQQSNIRSICERVKPEFVELETNGTISSTIDDIVNQFNISPKFDFNRPIVLPHSSNAFWKFVIRNEDDIQRADDFCTTKKIPHTNVLFQPEGQTKKGMQKTLPLVLQSATKRGVRVSPRLHILLWDDARSV